MKFSPSYFQPSKPTPCTKLPALNNYSDMPAHLELVSVKVYERTPDKLDLMRRKKKNKKHFKHNLCFEVFFFSLLQ
jgi:hypothetical protein